ncbi:MAG TPA: erythromycin esterase family protein [Methanospirillum sp.]|nr:erythromycin esterase family protein [Methanospirillum sp.]
MEYININPEYTTLEDWAASEAIQCSLDTPETFDTAVDRIIASLGESVRLLGLGEALHGGEEILLLRNRFFQHLVEVHGYRAIAIESSLPRARIVNEYISGNGPSSYEAVEHSGFSRGFRGMEGNRQLVEWMRQYNADPSHPVKLRFYGFDSPTDMTFTESPRKLLDFVILYLTSIDHNAGQEYRHRIEPLLGVDSDWENPAAMMDPTKSIGLSPAAAALRIEIEELITDMQIRSPELVAKSDHHRYGEAVRYASLARQLLTYHAAVARESPWRVSRLLGIRDAMMADNLAYIVFQEQERGKVLAFAHNSHLKRGSEKWQLGPDLCTWWMAGAHLTMMLGSRYAVIGSGIGISETQGIGKPEPGTLEALLTAVSGPVRFIPTHSGQGLPPGIVDLPVRSRSVKNSTYFPLTSQWCTDFDWLAVFDLT